MLIAIIAFAVVLLVAGFEMFMVLGIPTLMIKHFFFASQPATVLVQRVVGGVDHTTLLAIPFFIFAAELMGEGQIARRLMGFVRSLFGHLAGGMGYSAIGGAMAFGSISGSAPATVAALGGMIYPEMRKVGFSEKFSLGLIVSSAETALLVPPSITLIVYGWITGTSVSALFIGGISIGLLLGIVFAIYVAIEARRCGIERSAPASAGERLAAFRRALGALGMPLIIMGGIYSGFFTPTEAAAVSVVYAIIVEVLVYRGLSLGKLVLVTERAAITTSVIFILLAFGNVLAYFITLARLPQDIIGFLDALHVGPIVFLLAVNVIFLIAGMFIDPNSALLILVPTLFPVAQSLGIDPVHLGMIVTLNICIGMITPPFGLDIFVASSTLGKPVTSIVSGLGPFILANLVALGIVTYMPSVSMFLPHLFGN